jgi:hypothetical protein
LNLKTYWVKKSTSTDRWTIAKEVMIRFATRWMTAKEVMLRFAMVLTNPSC